MIHAKLDLDLLCHPRAHRAGEAMATWSWGLIYTRSGHYDGVIHADMLRTSWVGEEKARLHADRLVEVGLWIRRDDGDYEMWRYADKNETRVEIEKRLKKDRDRKKTGFRSDSKRKAVGIPGSGSGSVLCILEGGAGGNQPEVPEAPATGVRPSEQAYQRAYETGIREGMSNGAGYAMPENQRGALHQGIQAHSEGRRGDRLLTWIQAAAADFAEDMRKRPDEQKYYSAMGPRGWLRWLNEEAAKEHAKAVP